MRILVIPHATWQAGNEGLKCPIAGVSVLVHRNLDLVAESSHVLYLNTGAYEPGYLKEMGERARAAKIEFEIVNNERDLPERVERVARHLKGLPAKTAEVTA